MDYIFVVTYFKLLQRAASLTRKVQNAINLFYSDLEGPDVEQTTYPTGH